MTTTITIPTPSLPQTHLAIGVTHLKGSLTSFILPTPRPGAGQILVKTHYVGVTPLNQWRLDFGLLVKEGDYPLVLSGNAVGEVVAVGEGVREEIGVGDTIMTYSFATTEEKPFQEYVRVNQHAVAKLDSIAPFTPVEAASISDSFVTVWHSIATELRLPLPSVSDIRAYITEKKTNGSTTSKFTPPADVKDVPILIWGGGSSCGLYATQVLRLAGYTRIFVTASPRHFERLRGYGATHLFNYADTDVTYQIRAAVVSISGGGNGDVPIVLDCIGDEEMTVRPISHVVGRGSRVGILLPVRIGGYGSTTGVAMETSVPFPDGVEVMGVRTHFYQQNLEFKEYLQPVIMHGIFAVGEIIPNPCRLVEGGTFLERSVNALALIREGKVSGEKLVVKV